MQEPDMHDVIQLYQRQIGPISSSQRDRLYQAHEEGMEPFVLGCAILRASQERRLSGGKKKISFNYIAAIIKDWLVHGITDEKAYRAYFQDRPEESVKRRRNHGSQEGQRKFAREDYKYTKPEPPPKGAFSFLDD